MAINICVANGAARRATCAHQACWRARQQLNSKKTPRQKMKQHEKQHIADENSEYDGLGVPVG